MNPACNPLPTSHACTHLNYPGSPLLPTPCLQPPVLCLQPPTPCLQFLPTAPSCSSLHPVSSPPCPKPPAHSPLPPACFTLPAAHCTLPATFYDSNTRATDPCLQPLVCSILPPQPHAHGSHCTLPAHSCCFAFATPNPPPLPTVC